MKLKYTASALIVWLAIVIGLGIGWVMNILAVIHSDFAHITGLLVVRVIGVIVVPLGSFLGYFF